MANYANLKSDIAGVIRTNNNEEITGDILQEQLLGMVDSLGAGFQYKGVATPTTAPGTPDENVFYIASTAGTYTNFGGLVLAEGEVAILKYNGSWAKEVTGAATAAQVTQLGQELYELLPNETGPTITPNYSEGERFKNGNIGTTASFGHFEPILLPAHCTIVLNDGNNVYWSNIAVVYECDSSGNFIRPILTDGNYQSKPAIYTNDLDTDIYVGISCYKSTLKYCIKTPVEPVDYFEAKGDAIKNYILSESFTVVSATYNSEGIVSSASVKWPDGTTGTISVTRDSDGNATQVVATQGQDTYTLSITRNATGQVTATSIVKS